MTFECLVFHLPVQYTTTPFSVQIEVLKFSVKDAEYLVVMTALCALVFIFCVTFESRIFCLSLEYITTSFLVQIDVDRYLQSFFEVGTRIAEALEELRVTSVV